MKEKYIGRQKCEKCEICIKTDHLRLNKEKILYKSNIFCEIFTKFVKLFDIFDENC